MNSYISISLAVAVASAQTFVSTNNECWLGQGGRYTGECSDVYFFTCDEYEVDAATACNVFTFSDSRITWFPQDITVHYWSYYRNDGTSNDASVGGEDFGESKNEGKCHPIAEVPTQYTNGEVMNYTEGMCGFKYQITNGDEDYINKFTVLKDGAATLLAGSALALAALLAF